MFAESPASGTLRLRGRNYKFIQQQSKIIFYLFYFMAVHKKIPYSSGIFSVTFACARWLPLFEITNGYDFVYNFFDKLNPDFAVVFVVRA